MQLARASAGTGRKDLGRLSIRALTGSEGSGGKVIDESCRNEKKGRAQGTEVGEKALVPNVATVSCGRDSRPAGSFGPERARDEHAPPCVLAWL